MKLTLRFAVLVVALVAAVAASADAGLTALRRLDGALTRIVENDMERLLAITHTRRLFRSMVVQERDYILAKDEAERAPMGKKLKSLPKELDEQLDKYARLMPAEDTAVVAAIRAARQRWTELDEGVQAAAKRNQAEAFGLAKQHNQDPVPWEKAIGGLVKLSETRLADQVKQTHQVYLTAQNRLLGVSGTAAVLATVFGGAIFLGIRRNLREVVRLNSNLEAQVKARTQALAERERSLRLVLDSTGDGLFEVTRAGRLTGEASVAAGRWFGAPEAGRDVASYLFADDPERAASFLVAFDQLAEDILPWELCRDQMPRRLTRGEQTLELEWKRVLEQDDFTKILIVARDISDAVKSERAEKSAREQQSLIAKLLQDKSGFAQFVRECEGLLASLGNSQDSTVAKRDLHTLKGNTAIFGLNSLAEACHAIEDRVAQDGGLPSAADIADLAALWRTRMQSIEVFLSEIGTGKLEVEHSDHAQLIESLLARQDYDELIGMVELWSWPRTAERLSRLRAHVSQLAKRLDKQVQVSVEHNDLRLPAGYLDKFWPSMIHVLRNAVDHGAQSESARIAFGKSPANNIVLRTRMNDDGLSIEVCDDGPGVDRDALLLSARNKGYAAPNTTSLQELMFMDGVSSRGEVGELSGRGVGLAAVKQACEAEGGKIEVHSEAGRGTTFTFSFPRPVVKTGALAARLERRWSLLPRTAANRNSQRSLAKPA
jgi:signal transduction histidine kinase